MADSNIIYHGSNVIVENPQIIVSGFYKDFGYGFYCTSIEKQARKWALTKRGNSYVSLYKYQPAEGLKILSFPKMTDEWLDFVVDCRRGIKHDYDFGYGFYCTSIEKQARKWALTKRGNSYVSL